MDQVGARRAAPDPSRPRSWAPLDERAARRAENERNRGGDTPSTAGGRPPELWLHPERTAPSTSAAAAPDGGGRETPGDTLSSAVPASHESACPGRRAGCRDCP